MERSVEQIIELYDASAPLARASTIPAPWYTDPRILELELRTVFRRSWQYAGRLDQLRSPGDYISGELPAMRVKSRKPLAENCITSELVTCSSSSAVPTIV